MDRLPAHDASKAWHAFGTYSYFSSPTLFMKTEGEGQYKAANIALKSVDFEEATASLHPATCHSHIAPTWRLTHPSPAICAMLLQSVCRIGFSQERTGSL